MSRSTRVFVNVGSGGVGKSTISASLGFKLAKEGHKVLLITVDPSRRLADLLNLKVAAQGRVQSDLKGCKIDSWWMDSSFEFDEFIKEHSSSEEQFNKLSSNTLYQQLKTKLGGSQEFTSHLRLIKEFKSNKYDYIILDTPPVQNAKDFFEAPTKLHKLFSKSLFEESKNDSWFFSKISQASSKIVDILGGLTGKDFVNSLSEFFRLMKDISQQVANLSLESDQFLKSESVNFLLVTDVKRSEKDQVHYKYLKDNKYRVRYQIINKCPLSYEFVNFESESIQNHFEIYSRFVERAESCLKSVENTLDKSCSVVKINELIEEMPLVLELEHISKQLKDVGFI